MAGAPPPSTPPKPPPPSPGPPLAGKPASRLEIELYQHIRLRIYSVIGQYDTLDRSCQQLCFEIFSGSVGCCARPGNPVGSGRISGYRACTLPVENRLGCGLGNGQPPLTFRRLPHSKPDAQGLQDAAPLGAWNVRCPASGSWDGQEGRSTPLAGASWRDGRDRLDQRGNLQALAYTRGDPAASGGDQRDWRVVTRRSGPCVRRLSSARGCCKPATRGRRLVCNCFPDGGDRWVDRQAREPASVGKREVCRTLGTCARRWGVNSPFKRTPFSVARASEHPHSPSLKGLLEPAESRACGLVGGRRQLPVELNGGETNWCSPARLPASAARPAP